MKLLLNFKFVSSVVLVFFFFYYFVFSLNTLDPDFGWHLRFGEIILKTHSIPKTDLFSYTMSSYNFIDHEWLTDAVLAYLYPIINQFGFSILISLVAVSALFLQTKIYTSKWSSIPLVLSGMGLATFVFVRPQVISFFFFSALIYILFNKDLYIKLIYFIPFIFLLWANLHGGFALGIIVYILVTLSKSLEERRFSRLSLTVLFFSIVATFINPYGSNLWKEIFVSLNDINLRWSISEWLPSFFSLNIPYVVLAVFSLSIIVRQRSKFSLTEKVLYLVLLVFSVTSVRNIPFFLIFAGIILSKGLSFLFEELFKFKFGQDRFKIAYSAILTTLFIFLSISSWSNLIDQYESPNKYPKDAVSYLKQHPSKGQIFSTYNWGGYLIWKLPEKKVFVDGRMPSWKISSPQKNQSGNAFLEWKNIINGKVNFSDAVLKYKIDTVLISNPTNQSKLEEQIGSYMNNLFNIKTSPEDFLNELKDLKMTIAYKDQVATIYKKQ